MANRKEKLAGFTKRIYVVRRYERNGSESFLEIHSDPADALTCEPENIAIYDLVELRVGQLVPSWANEK